MFNHLVYFQYGSFCHFAKVVAVPKDRLENSLYLVKVISETWNNGIVFSPFLKVLVCANKPC